MIYCLANKQQSEGHQVTVIAAPSSRVNGCNVISFVRTRELPSTNFHLLNWFLRRIVEYRHHLKSLRWLGKSFDVIHCHMTEEGVGLGPLSDLPCIVTLHGTPYIATKFLWHFGGILAHFCNVKLVACSKYGYLKQRRIFGGKVIGYVHNGLDVSASPFVFEPNKLHDLELCFAGRIVRKKGLHLAIGVVDKLYEMGYDVHLKIHGVVYPGNLQYFNEILDMVRKRSYVTLKTNTPRAELLKSISNSDMMLFPSLFEEAFSYAIMESLSCGTPVAALNKGSVGEIIRNGVNGYCCENISQMVNACLNVSKTSRYRCREIVEKEFSSDLMYKKYLNMYQKMLACG